MGIEADNAALRIMLRAMAPMINETFEEAAKKMIENKYSLYMVVGHKPGGDLNNPKDHTILIRSIISKATAEMRSDPSKADAENEETLGEIFPVAKQLIAEQAEEWKVSPFHILMYLKLKKDAADPSRPDAIDLRLKTKKGIDPPREIVVA